MAKQFDLIDWLNSIGQPRLDYIHDGCNCALGTELDCPSGEFCARPIMSDARRTDIPKVARDGV